MNLPKVRKLAIVLVVGLVSLTLLALTNGPETTTDTDWVTGDDGITHNSTVHYSKDTNPFVAYVDKVHYGARPAADLEWWQFASEWKRDTVKYKVWDGNSWETEESVSADSWRDCGSPDSLCWWNVNKDVTLEDSARVDQRLKYRYFYYAAGKLNKMEWPGNWHRHYLE